MSNLAKKELNAENLLTEFEFEQRLVYHAERYHDNCKFHHFYILENLIKAKFKLGQLTGTIIR